MGEELDHVALTALTDALGVPLRVIYLDGGGAAGAQQPGAGPQEADRIDFLPDAAAARGETAPRLTLLYRPGHYDLLYPAHPAPPG